MRRGRTALAGCRALALVACSLLSSPAGALDDIPPECGSRLHFDAELRQRLGADIPLDPVRVAIHRTATGFRLRVQIGNELRELDDESCSELLRAAIVIAVSILMPESQSLEPAPPVPRTAEVSERSRPRFTLALGGGVSAGLLPPPVFTTELESKLLWHDWGIALSLRYFAPGQGHDAAGRGVRLHAFGAGALGVFRPSRRWEARLGFATQRLSGSGLNEEVPTFESQQDAAWTAGPALGLAFTPLELPPFWLGLGVEGQLDVLRPRFRILNYSEDVYAVPWLSGSAFVRLGVVW